MAGQAKEIVAEGVTCVVSKPKVEEYDKSYFLRVVEAKCENCGTCDEFCGTGAIQQNSAGKRQIVDPAACVNCGQCLIHCPFGAIREEHSFIDEVASVLKDPNRIAVAMIAPAVRYCLGEPFGVQPGTCVEGKMWAVLRRLGFQYVWDNQFAADLTIIEEGSELLGRIKGSINKPLPQFTSCCPGWVKFMESFYPDLLGHLSTCKSPIGMLGALAKTYGARQISVPAEKLYTVSIMPCTAKKFEGLRPEMASSGFRDIDATITTRELAYMIKKAGISFNTLPDEVPHPLIGESTGAATIFAVSGGVMEAALRFAYEEVTKTMLTNVDFHPVRGEKGIKSATVNMAGTDVKICVINGLNNAKPVLEAIRAGKSPYHFIEVMTCPTGCVNGGGQPLDPGTRTADVPFFKKLRQRLALLTNTVCT